MTIISIDLGHARTGLAISDATGFLASPLCVIEEKYDPKLVEKTAAVIKEHKADLIVVGLPKNMDGSEGESARRCRELAAQISGLSGVEYVMQDERGTTLTAHEYLSASNVYGKKRKQRVDATAAAIILQNYLDSKRP